MKRIIAKTFMLALALTAAANLKATTVVKMSFEKMAGSADAIVIGKAVSKESFWVGKRIYTRYTIAVAETLKGKAQPFVTVLVPGGKAQKGDFPVAMVSAGAPLFLANEETLLFLEKTAAVAKSGVADHRVVGFNQGKLSIIADKSGGKRLSRDLTGADVMEKGKKSHGGKDNFDLAALKTKIKQALAGQ